MFKRIPDREYKHSFAQHLFEVLEQSGSTLISNLLLGSVWDQYLQIEKDPWIRLEHGDIFIETLNELSHDARRAVILHDKHSIESEILENMPSKEWSDLWVKNIADPSKLTVYAQCSDCECAYAATVDYLSYLRESGEKGLMSSDCRKCGAEKMAAYYHWIPDRT